MYTALLYAHNIIRWILLLLLLVNIYKMFSSSTNKLGTSKWLLIFAHIQLLIGLYQYFFGELGFKLIQSSGMSAVMKDDVARFWAIEHIAGMIAAIVFITVGHISFKKSGNAKRTGVFYLLALIIILATVPWPFREGIGRPWFPGM